MHKRQQKENNTRNHNTRYNVVHPQCRGYVHKTVFYSTCYKTTVWSTHTAADPFSPFKPRTQHQASVHIATDLSLIFLQKPSAHTAAEVVHAHSWDLTFPYTINLSFTFLSLNQKPNFSYLQKCLFIHRAITKPWLQTMGTQNPKP